MAYQRREAPKNLEQVEGTIELVRKDGKGIKLDDENWYSVYALPQMNGAKKGDTVGFEYEIAEKGGQVFRNIKGNVEILNQSERAPAPQQQQTPQRSTAPQQRQSGGFTPKQFPIPADHPDRAIIRQNAANRAVEVLAILGDTGVGTEAMAEEAIRLARKFEAYYAGEEQ
jgi:hypothetical protein